MRRRQRKKRIVRSARTAIPPTTPPATAPTETCELVLEALSGEEIIDPFEVWALVVAGLAFFEVVVVTVPVDAPPPVDVVTDLFVDVVAPVVVVLAVVVDDVVAPLVVVVVLVVPTGADCTAGSTCLCQHLVNIMIL